MSGFCDGLHLERTWMSKGRVILLGAKPQKVHCLLYYGAYCRGVEGSHMYTRATWQNTKCGKAACDTNRSTLEGWCNENDVQLVHVVHVGKKPQLCEKTLYSPVLHRNLLWVVLYILSAHNFNSVPLSLFHRQSQTQHHLLLHLFQLCWWRESVCTRISLCTFFSHQKSLKSDDTSE